MFFDRCYFCVSMLAALLRALFFAFQCLQRYCEHCFLHFSACSVTASIVFCVSTLAALLRALFFAFYRLQRHCEHCFLRFIACSVTASIVFCVSALAALLRALFFAFQCLQHYCEHCFLRFGACSVTASIVFCVLVLAALLRALFFAFQCLQRYCEHCFLRFIACSVTASTVFCVLSFAALLRALKLLVSSSQLACTCWNGRGGACVPARTSAQRRFHTKIYLRITHHARGFNDGCAPAGRHGRAHRHRPYPSPSYFSVQSAHNQRPHRPRSCNTIHYLEIDESANTFTFPSRRFRGESERVRTAIHKVDGAGFQGVILRTGPIPIVG